MDVPNNVYTLYTVAGIYLETERNEELRDSKRCFCFLIKHFSCSEHRKMADCFFRLRNLSDIITSRCKTFHLFCVRVV